MIMKRKFLLIALFAMSVISFAQTELLTCPVYAPSQFNGFRWSGNDMINSAIQKGNAEETLYWMQQDFYDMVLNKMDKYKFLAYSYCLGHIVWGGEYEPNPQYTNSINSTCKIRGCQGYSNFETCLIRTNMTISRNWQLSIQYFKKALAYKYLTDSMRRKFCLKIGVMYEIGGNGVTQNIAEAKKWYKKGASYTKEKDESFLLCEKALVRVEQKGTMLASASKQKPTKEEKPVKVVETPQPKQEVAVAEKPKQQVEQKVVQTPTASKKEIFPVDVSIPSNSKKADYTYVLIIANENYEDVENVKFALNDGRIFKEYCEKTLGIPASNIRMKEDATLNNIISGVDWLKSICEASNGKGKCIVYYSGHGIPDESTQSSYILPVDGSGKNIRTGYSLNELYTSLGELPVESATMFIDACFSGANRGNNMLVAARGVAIKAKPEAPKGKLVVFSAAQSDETAFPYEDAKHGMFTYFLLRKLKETKGNCSLSELGDYLKENVTRTAILENDKPQTPAISVSPLMENSWREIKLK